MSRRVVSVLFGSAAAFWLVTAAVIVALVLSGCGGSSSPTVSTNQGAGTGPTGPSNGTPPGFDPAALRRFTACMRTHGVTVPSTPGGAPRSGQSGGPPGFLNSAKSRSALQACRQFLPRPGASGAAPPGVLQ